MAREQGRAGGYRSAAASRAGGNGQDRLMTSILIEGSGKMAGDRSGRRQIRTATANRAGQTRRLLISSSDQGRQRQPRQTGGGKLDRRRRKRSPAADQNGGGLQCKADDGAVRRRRNDAGGDHATRQGAVRRRRNNAGGDHATRRLPSTAQIRGSDVTDRRRQSGQRRRRFFSLRAALIPCSIERTIGERKPEK